MRPLKDVRFEVEIGGIERFECYIAIGECFVRLLVNIEFVVQAALEFTALSCQFLRSWAKDLADVQPP